MTSPRSASDPPPPAPGSNTDTTGAAQSSSAFTRLHPQIQRWIWEQNWTELRDAQERAIDPVLAGNRDLIISAATAAGKTEAAFLPICSALLNARPPLAGSANPAVDADADGSLVNWIGIQALYVSPLKALINDQYGRLDALCEHLDLPVHRWHGDVAGSRKAKVLREPDGLLLITPESLEALFVIHGPKMSHLFAGLRYVVIDEMHSFLGTERGAQLQSLLHRVELAVRHRVPRIGLSATLGDMPAAANFLRPGCGENVAVIVSAEDKHELRLQLRGYEAKPADLSPREAEAAEDRGDQVDVEDVTEGDRLAIADHLFSTLRGTDNLIFANSRREVEIYADLLSRRCEAARLPNEFVPHHGSLSKDLREHAESRLKDRDIPVNAVCTSTLEMGIDIGSVASIAQIGAPRTVASLRQRLGRSGRRGGAATLRLYVTEEQITPKTTPPDALRAELVQSIAMVDLLLARWNEAPDAGGLHLSTLTQQLLSLIAQHGGVTPLDSYRTLCETGPFARVTPDLFKLLLRALADDKVDFLTQATDGLLLLGVAGERVVNHYSFYAAFRSPSEYRLVANGRTLGTLPVDYPLMPGSLLIFGGRRWKVLAVDAHAKVVELVRSSGGRPPQFSGGGGEVADEVRQAMLRVYTTADVPSYLDRTAVSLLAEGRANFARFGLGNEPLLPHGNDLLVFPWRGDRICGTLTVALTADTTRGSDVSQDGVCLTMTNTTREQAGTRLQRLLDDQPDPVALAAQVGTKVVEKYDEQLSDELLDEAFAARSLDVPRTWEALRGLVDQIRAAEPAEFNLGRYDNDSSAETLNSPTHPSVAAPPSPIPATSRRRPLHRPELGTTSFAVVDIETTGFSPRLHDRVIEVAVVRTAPDGSIEDSWSTLLNPDRDLGPTHVHGLRGIDVLDAPRFADVAGDLADRLHDAVVVAHNARFDLGFITAEYTRLGGAPPTWPALCSLALSHQLGTLGGGRLTDCLTAEGLRHDHAHSALGDATATAQLLGCYLRRAGQQGITSLTELGCLPDEWYEPADWSVWPTTGLTRTRSVRPLPEASPLAQLVRHLPAHDVSKSSVPGDLAAYFDVLDRALEDRRLTDVEVAALTATATEWGLSRRDVHHAHTAYLRALAVTALADNVLTELEATDLADVASALGLGGGEVAAALHDARSHEPDVRASDGHELRGLGVCFTGTLQARVGGTPMTREHAQRLARAGGLVVHERVTRALDLLVVADPNSLSGKAKKALEYGTRVVAEAEFWRRLAVTTDGAVGSQPE